MTTTIIFSTPVNIREFVREHRLAPHCSQKNYHVIKEIAIRQIHPGVVSIVTDGEYPQNSRFFEVPSAVLTSYIEAAKPEAATEAGKQEALRHLLLEIVRQPPQSQFQYFAANMSPEKAIQELQNMFSVIGLSMDKVLVWNTPYPHVKGYIGVHICRNHS